MKTTTTTTATLPFSSQPTSSPMDIFMLKCTSTTLTYDEKNALLSDLSGLASEILSRLFSKKEAIAILQEWVLLADRSLEDLSIAILALQSLNSLPWTIIELQQYKLGRTVRRASSLLVKNDKFEYELKKMLVTIEDIIGGAESPNPGPKGPPSSGLLIKKDDILNGIGGDRMKVSPSTTPVSFKRDTFETGGNACKGMGPISSPKMPQTSTTYGREMKMAILNRHHQPDQQDQGRLGINENLNPISAKGAVPFDPFESHSIVNKKSCSVRQPVQEKGSSAQLPPKAAPPHDPRYGNADIAYHAHSSLDVYVEIISSKKRSSSSRMQRGSPEMKRKRVSFKADDQLVQVNLFELDPTERKNPNFNPAMAYGDLNAEEEAFFSLKIKETEDLYRPYSAANSTVLVPTMKWKPPRKLQFNEHYTLADGANSLERSRQQQQAKHAIPYRCIDLSKCPANPTESPPSLLPFQSPKLIPQQPASSTTSQLVQQIDEHALDSLLGSLTNPTHNLFESTPVNYPQEYTYHQTYQHYPIPVQEYQQPPQPAYPQANYAQYPLAPIPNSALYPTPCAPKLPPGQQVNSKIRQVNCPPEKLRRVRCHYYDPQNPAACVRGSTCTFLHQ